LEVILDIFKVSKIFFNREDAEKEKERIEGLFDPPPKEVFIEWNYDRDLKKEYLVFFKLD